MNTFSSYLQHKAHVQARSASGMEADQIRRIVGTSCGGDGSQRAKLISAVRVADVDAVIDGWVVIGVGDES